jgi:hypothetical protein
MGTIKRIGSSGLQQLTAEAGREQTRSLKEIIGRLGIDPGSDDGFIESLPFSINDATAGSENELQAAVVGEKRDVDLPLAIERSNFYANILRRANAGETPRRLISDLEAYLHGNREKVWENSWVRFPEKVLCPYAKEVLDVDFMADKKEPAGGMRADVDRFVFHAYGEKWLRLPLSYVLKLSLAQVIGIQKDVSTVAFKTGKKLLDHFSNDNTSPETFSFYVVPLRPGTGMGRSIAKETAKRFLLTQILTQYANTGFRLRENGQQTVIYSAPHPPIRQRQLNEFLPDSFYRELFMSPCLSGWDRGEAKHDYMCLCHRVLSRSQLNGVAKLRDAGIVTNNLVVLPNMSNISLANNGTHLSLGSTRLSRLLADRSAGLTRADEKLLGDLAIKIVEHFLPLFVGTYSAAPYRMGFSDFHPEKALGFLPHELDYTHLRMIWRRWKKKADLKVFFRPLTPFGPEWLDRAISAIFRLKGDFVPDFRLVDYFVSLMSTDQSPALDGRIGNGERLKQDLADFGVFDQNMALYLLYRLREFDSMGFSGFEGRQYSLFYSLVDDMGAAANLQLLLNALAFKYIALGKIAHQHIPDTPSIESERRQIFFGTAIGIPTFYVRKNTSNLLLRRIVARCPAVRSSRRYPGYLRVYNVEYRRALIELIREDAADLIEMLDLSGTIEDLQRRLDRPEECSALGKITRSVLDDLGSSSPMRTGVDEFNRAAERYYRDVLRRKYLEEGFNLMEEDIWSLDPSHAGGGGAYAKEVRSILRDRSPLDFLFSVKQDLMEETASPDELITLIGLLLITIHHDMSLARQVLDGDPVDDRPETPIRRAAHW